MPPESSSHSRKRVQLNVKARIGQHLAHDLVKLARKGLFAAEWLTAAQIANRLEQAGYWTTHPEPLAAFLPSPDCVALVGAAVGEVARNDARSWWSDNDRFKPHTTDWNASAADTALRLRLARRNEERTAIFGGPDEPSVIFANENYAAYPEVRQQIVNLRDSLRAAGIPELAFATSPDGAAWVMLVWTASEQLLQSVLLSQWATAATA